MARRMQRAVVVLPQPLSPTRPSVSPFVDVEVDAVDGADVAHRPLQEALPDRKELLQPVTSQQRTPSATRMADARLVEEAAHRVCSSPTGSSSGSCRSHVPA